MNISYEGSGQLVVTALVSGEAEIGAAVQFTDNAAVTAAVSGAAPEGVIVSKRGDYAAVAVRGFISLPADSSVSVGLCKLVCDGNGGVTSAADGSAFLVVSIDNDMATFLL